jgi:hypothetical protein
MMKRESRMPVSRRADSDLRLDRTRPRTLLTALPQHAIRLLYRYDDTGQTVAVANLWYNQSIEGRVAQLLWGAEQHELHAAWLQRGPRSVPPVLMRRMVDKLMTRALLYREVAKRLAREGESFFASAHEFLAHLND